MINSYNEGFHDQLSDNLQQVNINDTNQSMQNQN